MTKTHHPANRYERKLIEEKIKFDHSPKGRTGKVRHRRLTEEVQELYHELKEFEVRQGETST